MRCTIEMIRRYACQTSAAVAIVFGLTVPVVIGAVGMSVDLAQSYLVRERLYQSLDAAALAAAAMSSEDPDEIEQKVNDFIEANYPAGSIGYTVDIDVFPSDNTLRVTATAQLPTTFMRAFGTEYVDVYVETTVAREVRGIEVALVLDVTGSMATNNNIGALRTATLNFVDTIFDRVENEDYLRVSLVPYAATVNVGSIAPEIVSALPQFPAGTNRPYSETDNPATTADDLNWRGCVRARTVPHDREDTDIAEGGFWEPFWWSSTMTDANDNRWWRDLDNDGVYDGVTENNLNRPFTQCNDRRTPNLGCPESNPIVPLTNDYDLLRNSANALVYWCRGGTFSNEGMAWGLRVLSPEEPFDEGASFDDPLWRKAVILMTDGDNQFFRKSGITATSDMTAYGRLSEGRLGTTNATTARTEINEGMTDVCNALKEKGVTVYTVTFASSINTATKALYEDCASDPTKWHDAPTQQALIEVFGTIARELSNLHISQ